MIRDSPFSSNYTCQCSMQRSKVRKGFSNLMSHLERKHSSELATANQQGFLTSHLTFSSILYLPKAIIVHGWLCYIRHCLRPFSAAQKHDVREHIKYDSISVNKFKNDMHLLVEKVEITSGKNSS